MTITLNIKVNSETNFTVEAEPSFTVKELKILCESQSNIEAQNQRLICKGKLLKDTDILSDVGAVDGATVYLVRSQVNKTQSAAPKQNTVPQPTLQTTNQPAGQTQTSGLGFQQQGFQQGFSGSQQPGFQANPFQSMLAGGFPNLDPTQMMEILNSPMAQEAMQRLSQNPEVLRNILQNSSLMTPMLEQNPMLSEMLSNPELMRSMLRPEVLQAGLQMHQAMQQQQQQQPGTQTNPIGSQNPDFSNMMRQMMNVFQQNPSVAQPTAPQVYTDPRPPAERFATQLQALAEMGFIDTEKNITALIATNGDLNATVTRLLESNF